MHKNKLNILLLGEYSSFHKYLKDGLIALGHNVVLASEGDGWKEIPGKDMDLWNIRGKNRYSKLMSEIITSFQFAKRFEKYDVVQLVNTHVYFYAINDLVIKKIRKQNNKLFSLACVGYDLALLKAYKAGSFEYYIPNFLKEIQWSSTAVVGWLYRRSDKKVVSMCDILIPGLYEYSVGYKNNNKLYSTIPMPVNTKEIEYKENIVDNKVIFFHGLNRENAKGTSFIREAFSIISKKYRDQVEVIIEGNMPFDKYTKVIEKANVIVDQCCCYGYGINSLISMAKGKVVMAGAHPKTLEAFGISKCPIFHATPNVGQLVEQMSYIIDNKNMISEWGEKSREYVENLHDCKKVAKQYIEAWESTGKI